MLNPNFLSAVFRSGNLTDGRIRPSYVGQFFVVSACCRDPVLAVRTYRALSGPAGVPTYAAERFLALLEAAQAHPSLFRVHELLERRRIVGLPA
jgi:hypothetical protein